MLKKIFLALCLILSTNIKCMEQKVTNPQSKGNNTIAIKSLTSLKTLTLNKLASSNTNPKIIQICNKLPIELIEPLLEYCELNKLYKILKKKSLLHSYHSILDSISSDNFSSVLLVNSKIARLFSICCNNGLSFAAYKIFKFFCNYCLSEIPDNIDFIIKLIRLINLEKLAKLNLQSINLSSLLREQQDLYNQLESFPLDIANYKTEDYYNFNVQPFTMATLLQANIKTLKLLLQKGATTNDKDSFGNTALNYIFRNGNRANMIFTWLLQHGVDTNNAPNIHPLYNALANSNFDAANKLLEKIPLDKKPGICSRALAELIKLHPSYTKSSQFLIDLKTPISTKVLKALIKQFPSSHELYSIILQEKFDPKWLNYLHLCRSALKHNKQELLKDLIYNKLELLKKYDSKQKSFLLAACKSHSQKNNALNLITFILDQGCYVDTREADSSTPLMYACKEGKLEVVEILIKNGADPMLKKLPTLEHEYHNILEKAKKKRGTSPIFEAIYQLVSNSPKASLFGRFYSK